MLLLPVSLFLVGLGVLLLSTYKLVDTSQKLAHKANLSPLIIGITVVALGTSLPELVVSLVAVIEGDYGLALGNIVGSNITNILLVLGVGILFGNLRIGTTKTPKNTLILVGATALFILLHYFTADSRVYGVVLISLGLVVTFVEYYWGLNGQKYEDLLLLRRLHKRKVEFTRRDIFILIGTPVGVIVGGIAIVYSVESLSLILGYSTTILGLCLTAVATSLPELFTTIFSQNTKNDKLTLGNILGSNIYNITFIGGISYLFVNGQNLAHSEWAWLAGSTAILFFLVFLLKGKYLSKLLGILLILTYFVYLFSTFYR